MKNSQNKMKKWIIILLMPVILIIGVLIGTTVLADNSDGINFVDFGGNEESEEVHMPLEEFLINIPAESNNRNSVVRMDLTVSSAHDNANNLIEDNIAIVRDAVIHVVSNHSAELLYEESEDGEFVIKNDMRERINQALEDEIISDIYITNILMQN